MQLQLTEIQSNPIQSNVYVVNAVKNRQIDFLFSWSVFIYLFSFSFFFFVNVKYELAKPAIFSTKNLKLRKRLNLDLKPHGHLKPIKKVFVQKSLSFHSAFECDHII